jgi:hypothetical protein
MLHQMAQLWLNLPAKDKMNAPKYQPILSKDVPSVPLPSGKGSVSIIAGELNGVKGPAFTHSPVK